ncbi:hypothetical protein ZWY2020_000571 [Hordeum vulgare]|nr:hypothetical protein ZWY2020_000571 [Hordeum vulgare]
MRKLRANWNRAMAALSWVADAARWAEDTRPAAAPPLLLAKRHEITASFEDAPVKVQNWPRARRRRLGPVADDDGNRALHLAAMEGRVEICRYLVKDLRLDVNKTNATDRYE